MALVYRWQPRDLTGCPVASSLLTWRIASCQETLVMVRIIRVFVCFIGERDIERRSVLLLLLFDIMALLLSFHHHDDEKIEFSSSLFLSGQKRERERVKERERG